MFRKRKTRRTTIILQPVVTCSISSKRIEFYDFFNAVDKQRDQNFKLNKVATDYIQLSVSQNLSQSYYRDLNAVW